MSTIYARERNSVGGEGTARQPRPLDRALALFDPLLTGHGTRQREPRRSKADRQGFNDHAGKRVLTEARGRAASAGQVMERKGQQKILGKTLPSFFLDAPPS